MIENRQTHALGAKEWFKFAALCALACAVLGCSAPQAPEAPEPTETTLTATEPSPSAVVEDTEPATASAFVPATFDVPTLVEHTGFKVVPLGPDLVDIDYDAYMSSIEHLQQTFTRSTGWPTADIDDEAAMQDMLNEERRFKERSSFAYAVLTPDGERERGCVYVRPSSKPGYDAEVRLWVTKEEYDAGFDGELFAWAQEWVSSTWPLSKVAYPGRSIDWAVWDALPDLDDSSS